MQVLPTTGQAWLSLALFPFKAYTALAYVAVRVWSSQLPPRADDTEGGGLITLGYAGSFAALCAGGMIQKTVGPRSAYLMTCAFAVADLLFIVLLLPYLAHT
jgi:predicted MFS family arabinose efflux permease